MNDSGHPIVKQLEVEIDMADTTKSGVYTLAWRRIDEPTSARHWGYYLSPESMASAMAPDGDEGTSIVIMSAGWLSMDDMLDLSSPAFS